MERSKNNDWNKLFWGNHLLAEGFVWITLKTLFWLDSLSLTHTFSRLFIERSIVYGLLSRMLVNIWLLANVFFIKLGSKQTKQQKREKNLTVSKRNNTWSCILFFCSVCSCLGMCTHYGRKINVAFKIGRRKKNEQKKVKPKKGFVYIPIFFSSFKCNLVLFADIGYRLYVQPSITALAERMKQKFTIIFCWLEINLFHCRFLGSSGNSFWKMGTFQCLAPRPHAWWLFFLWNLCQDFFPL